MAAPELLQVALPHPWNYGVTRDGRIFFINEESRSTTWLHPKRHHPVQSGHMGTHDLPKGWERNFTSEGITYYIDHINLKTQFHHPISGEAMAVDVLPQKLMEHETVEPRRSMRKKNGKSRVIERTLSARRSVQAQVVCKGWLYKQDQGGLKIWKKKYFVLSELCLYYYKDSDEKEMLGSIVLPSYSINPCTKKDGTSKKYAFKAEHENMRTYFFATDTLDDMKTWLEVLRAAANVQHDSSGNSNSYNVEDKEGGFISNSRQSSFSYVKQPPQRSEEDIVNPHYTVGPQYGIHQREHGNIPYSRNSYPQRSADGDSRRLDAQTAHSQSSLSPPSQSYHTLPDINYANYPEKHSMKDSYRPNKWEGNQQFEKRQDSYSYDDQDYQKDSYNVPESEYSKYSSTGGNGYFNRHSEKNNNIDDFEVLDKKMGEQLTIDTNPHQAVENWNSGSLEGQSKIWKSLEIDQRMNLINRDRNMEPHAGNKMQEYMPSKQQYASQTFPTIYQNKYDKSPNYDERHQGVSYSKYKQHGSPLHPDNDMLLGKTYPKEQGQNSFQVTPNRMYEDTTLPRVDTAPDGRSNSREEYVQQDRLPQAYREAKQGAGEFTNQDRLDTDDRLEYPDAYYKAKEQLQHSPIGDGYHFDHDYDSRKSKENRKTELQEKRRKNLSIIKEDPSMPDKDLPVIRELKNLNKMVTSQRQRLSIDASDLIGKSHEELVLLLIQLRRHHSQLKNARNIYKQQLGNTKGHDKEYQRQKQYATGRHLEALEMEHAQHNEYKKQLEDIEKDIEVQKPLINLLHNMVSMGSLYGGDNLMFATQYKKHRLQPDQYIPPKKMIEFTRKHQEDQLNKEQREELQEMMADEADLEAKQEKLYSLDRELQDHSLAIADLQEDKQLLEKALDTVRTQQLSSRDYNEQDKLQQQVFSMEDELTNIRQDLAFRSKLLEEAVTENAKLEHDIILLRKKLDGDFGRSQSTPSLSSESFRKKEKLERELNNMTNVMEDLHQQGAKLSEVMTTLRHSTPDLSTDEYSVEQKSAKKPTFLETDLDTMCSVNLAPTAYYRNQREYRSDLPKFLFQKANKLVSGVTLDEQGELTSRIDRPPDTLARPHGTVVQETRQRVRDVKKRRDASVREKRSHSLPRRISDQDILAATNKHHSLPATRDDFGIEQSMQYWGDESLGLSRSVGQLWNQPQNPESNFRRSGLLTRSDRNIRDYGKESSEGYRDIGRRSQSVRLPRAKSAIGLTRDADKRTASERLFPVNQRTSFTATPSQTSENNMDIRPQENTHRMADLFIRKPFAGISGDVMVAVHGVSVPIKGYHDEQTGRKPLRKSQHHKPSIATVRPVMAKTSDNNLEEAGTSWKPNMATVKPWQADPAPLLAKGRKGQKDRYQTISTDQPFLARTEDYAIKHRPVHNSVAGDLIMTQDLGRSERNKDTIFDESTIDREVLYGPGKVEIPDRFYPEPAEQISEEEKMFRRERAERIRSVLAKQSLQQFSREELPPSGFGDIHRQVQAEKLQREEVLGIRQALAREAMQQSRQAAEQRRKTLEAEDLSMEQIAAYPSYSNDPYVIQQLAAQGVSDL